MTRPPPSPRFPPVESPAWRCVTPEAPDYWKRQFPVFGATSGTVACMGALEAIKLLAGFGKSMERRMLQMDLRDMQFHEISLENVTPCHVCADH